MNIVLFLQPTATKSLRDKLRGIYRFAREQDWHVQVENASNPSHMRELINMWQPIGCLVNRAMEGGSANPQAPFGDLPTVFLDLDPRKLKHAVFRVTHDSAASTLLAVTELMSLSLDNYAYVGWEKPLFWSEERRLVFKDAARREEKRFASFALTAAGDLASWLSALPKPCGILGANDFVAAKVLAVCRQIGIAVPQEIAVIGVDNDELICENTRPTLTSVLPDFERGGWLLANLLAERLRDPSASPRELTYGPRELVRRESTLRFPNADVRVTRAVALIRRRACEGLKVADVVSEMGCSRRLADLRFGEATGHSILNEIHEVRLAKAFRLLRDPSLPISEIVSRCGYDSEPFLKKLFHTQTGLSMSDWRKKNGLR